MVQNVFESSMCPSRAQADPPIHLVRDDGAQEPVYCAQGRGMRGSSIFLKSSAGVIVCSVVDALQYNLVLLAVIHECILNTDLSDGQTDPQTLLQICGIMSDH
ncbi:hypothetical protein DIPPA_53640 [Diplonema papillatum]|nr:hypothetical protein DIPPA_53640 [Diplonema papillatum]